jgi:hypothetical protein
LFFDSRREQDINNFARREITRKNCPPRGLSYYINSHHIDGILSAFRRDCFSIDVARRARLLHDGTGEREREREREKEKEILRFWNDLSPLSLFSCFCSFLLLCFFGLSSKMKQKAEGEQTNSLLMEI